MKKNRVRSIVIHIEENANFHALSDKVSGFHVEVIERRLNQMDLTAEQKIAVIDGIIKSLKSREISGVIK